MISSPSGIACASPSVSEVVAGFSLLGFQELPLELNATDQPLVSCFMLLHMPVDFSHHLFRDPLLLLVT